MAASLLAFSVVEQAALAKVLRDFPAAVLALETGLRPILERLVRECRGIVLSEDEADYVLAGLPGSAGVRSARWENWGKPMSPSRHRPADTAYACRDA
jgi:hypothetical protein